MPTASYNNHVNGSGSYGRNPGDKPSLPPIQSLLSGPTGIKSQHPYHPSQHHHTGMNNYPHQPNGSPRASAQSQGPFGNPLGTRSTTYQDIYQAQTSHTPVDPYGRQNGTTLSQPQPPSFASNGRGYPVASPPRNGYSDGRAMPGSYVHGASHQTSPPYPASSSSNGYPSPYGEVPPVGYPREPSAYDSVEDRPTTRRRRGNLPKWATDVLKDWFFQHIAHPYPTEQEKQDLCKVTGLGMTQLSNWFINARRRQHPVLQSQAQAENIIRQGSNHTSNGGDSPGMGRQGSQSHPSRRAG